MRSIFGFLSPRFLTWVENRLLYGEVGEPHSHVQKRTYQSNMTMSFIFVILLACAFSLFILSLESPEIPGGGQGSNYQAEVNDPNDDQPDSSGANPSGGSAPVPTRFVHHEGRVNGYRIISDNEYVIEIDTSVTERTVPDDYLTPDFGDGLPTGDDFAGVAGGIGDGGPGHSRKIYIAPEYETSALDPPPRELASRDLQVIDLKDPIYPPKIPDNKAIRCATIVVVYVDENGVLAEFPESLNGQINVEYYQNGQKHNMELLKVGGRLAIELGVDTVRHLMVLNGPKTMEYSKDGQIREIEYAQYIEWFINTDEDSVNIVSFGTGEASRVFAESLIRPIINSDIVPRIVDGRSVGTWFASAFSFSTETGTMFDWMKHQLHFQRLQRQLRTNGSGS